MSAIISLPLDDKSQQTNPGSLPRVGFVERKSPLLHPGPIPDRSEVLSLNLTQGCAHRCVYCSARAYRSYPGDDVVNLYANSAAKLEEELAGRHRPPRAVYISPSTDPFMPLVEVQSATAEVMAVLARRGVEAWFMTRGFVRPSAMEVLLQNRKGIRLTVGLMTLNRALQRKLEPLAAPPRLRLRQIENLLVEGVSVQVEVAPLIPGLTDTHENLAELVDALADKGVTRITTGYMFLRDGIRKNLEQTGLDSNQFMNDYAQGPVLPSDCIAPARYLKKKRRQLGYARLMALAASRGIRVTVSSLTNPDFAAVAPAPVARQRLLPYW